MHLTLLSWLLNVCYLKWLYIFLMCMIVWRHNVVTSLCDVQRCHDVRFLLLFCEDIKIPVFTVFCFVYIYVNYTQRTRNVNPMLA